MISVYAALVHAYWGIQMIVRNICCIIGSVFFLAACAQEPESIAAVYVSPTAYQDYSCEQLADENARVGVALTEASEKQRQARERDTMGLMLLRVPVSSVSGADVAEEVARLKGEQQTLRQTMATRNCTTT